MTMFTHAETLEKIRQYGDHVERTNMLSVDAHDDRTAHEERLRETITYLQKRVQEQQAALEKVVRRFYRICALPGLK